MEVGTEISQKIRSAIKAKLIELGAYVDDELPDYIMVMVANKKSREQMISDLSLFLGKHTDAFAEWLHGLLGKLQTISVDSSGSKAGISKEKKKSDSKKEKKVKKASRKGADSQGKKVKSVSGSSKKKVSTDDKTALVNSENSKGNSESSDKPKNSNSTEQRDVQVQNEGEAEGTEIDGQGQSATDSVEVEDVRQMLVTVAPTDELAAELETTEDRIEQAQVGKPSIPVVEERMADHAAVRRKRSASPRNERRVQSSIAPKKHKGLTSVVASISKDVEEEEYDPLCPAVGSVASVVKVTSRKSRVPPALQANSVNETLSLMEREEDGIEGQSDCLMVRLDQTASLDLIRSSLMAMLREHSKEKEEVDSISAFCQSIASSMRKMNQRNLAIAKLRIQKILFDYESSFQSAVSDGSRVFGGAVGADPSNSQIKTSGQQDSVKMSCSLYSNSNIDSNTPDYVENTNSKGKSSDTTTTAANKNLSSFNSGLGPESPSSVSQSSSSSITATAKPDNSVVTSSRNDRLSPFQHQYLHQTEFPSRTLNNPQTSSSQINSSSAFHSNKSRSGLFQSTKTSIQKQTISLESLHLKSRSELESSPSCSGKTSVLKFRPLLHNSLGASSGDNNNSGSDSPKPLSAEQLKVLAKNLKITITNSRASKSSNGDDSSSEEEETDSDDDDEDDSDEEEVENKVGEVLASKDAEEKSSMAVDTNVKESNEAVTTAATDGSDAVSEQCNANDDPNTTTQPDDGQQ